MRQLHYEIIKASRYYGKHATGWVALINGDPHHCQSKEEAFEFVDPTPSSEDIAITKRLKEAGDLMGIKLLDHVIVGEGAYLSFTERGLL